MTDKTRCADKVREDRLRRMARRQRLQLIKSRTRDWRAADYGRWMVVDPYASTVVAGGDLGYPSMTVDDVERFLTDE